jgi:tetrahydromethanopterin S-methyltransferase subunit F
MTESIAILVGSAVIVLLVRIPRRLIPRHYFEIAELIHGMNGAITWPAVIIRFSVPLFVALLGTLIIVENEAFVGAAMGCLAAILLVWPTLLDRRLLPSQVIGREAELYVVFGMFVASFAFIGLAAGLIASFLQEPLDRALSGRGAKQIIDAAGDKSDELIIGIVAAVLATTLISGWKFLYRYIQRVPNGY